MSIFEDLEDDFYSGQWKYVHGATPERRAHGAQFGLRSMENITSEEFMRRLDAEALWQQSGGGVPPEYDEDFDEVEEPQPPKFIPSDVPTYQNGEWI